MSELIVSQGLTKSFRVQRKAAGMAASLRGLFVRQTETHVALKDATFRVERGECIGVLGPNGAGKTTLMKLLTGILTPTSGKVHVLGHEPSKREHALLRRIALVLGGKGQLIWDLPANESFLLARAVYDIPEARFRSSLDSLSSHLHVREFIDVPVRKLSLGQRMRLELCLALLHDPEVLFLDEPTLGLDVVSQLQVREFLLERNRSHGTTILITSHYMEDIEALAKRVLVIGRGQLLLDTPYRTLVTEHATTKEIELRLERAVPAESFTQFGRVLTHDEAHVVLEVPRARVPETTAKLLADFPVIDLNVREADASEIVRRLFGEMERA